jgi:hypothetical protein
MARENLDRTETETETEGTPNRDPLTGEPGAHPVGVGLGAAGAGAAGAALGMAGGPVGAAVGAVVGAVAGGLLGKGIAESVDPTAEDAYWRENYSSRPYAVRATSYEDLQPAYRHGWESRSRYAGRSFDEAESDIARDWASCEHSRRMTWDAARPATRDAWDRIESDVPGDHGRLTR